MFAVALALILSFINIFIMPEIDEKDLYSKSNSVVDFDSDTPFTDVLALLNGEPMDGASVKSFCDLSLISKRTYCTIVCNKTNLQGYTLPGDIPLGYNYGSIVKNSIHDENNDTYAVHNIRYDASDDKYHIDGLKKGFFKNPTNLHTEPTYDDGNPATYVSSSDLYKCYAIVDDSTGDECGILFAATDDTDTDTNTDTEEMDQLLSTLPNTTISGDDLLEIAVKFTSNDYCLFISNYAYLMENPPASTTAYNYGVVAEGMSETIPNTTLIGYKSGEYLVRSLLHGASGELQRNDDFSPIMDADSVETFVARNYMYRVFAVKDESTGNVCGLFCSRVSNVEGLPPRYGGSSDVELPEPDTDETPKQLLIYYKEELTGEEVVEACKDLCLSTYCAIVCTKNQGGFYEVPCDVDHSCNYGALIEDSMLSVEAFNSGPLRYVIDDNKYHINCLQYNAFNESETLNNTDVRPLTQEYNAETYVDQTATFKSFLVVDDSTGKDCGIIFLEVHK